MNSHGNGPPKIYQVISSQKVLQTIKEITARAIAMGQEEQYSAALQVVYNRLSRDPNHFGEPLYRLPALKVWVRVAAVFPLIVHFAVHVEKPVVFIKGIKDITAS